MGAPTFTPALLALDWGTTGLRGFLMADGVVREERQAQAGIQQLGSSDPARFGQALDQLAGDWLRQWPSLPIIACGMVGSAQGWREAPYAATPADPLSLGRQSVQIGCGATTVHIIPGVIHQPPAGAPDVMRGEETQVTGALLQHPGWADRTCFVLPGTHSKWVAVRDGHIRSLRTFMTGEVYAVMRQHSILGRLMPPDASVDAAEARQAFDAGVRAVRDDPGAGLLHLLFSARTLGVAGGWSHAVLGDYLSGLLLGSELMGAQACGDLADDTPLVLVGSARLCERYDQALAVLGRPADARLDNTAPHGMWSVAQALGLIG